MVSIVPKNSKGQPISFCELIAEVIEERRRSDTDDWPSEDDANTNTNQVELYAQRFPFIYSLFSKSFMKDGVYKAFKREQHMLASAEQIQLEFNYIPLRGSLYLFTNNFRLDDRFFIVSAVFLTDKYVYLCDGHHADCTKEAKAFALSGLKDQIFLDPTFNQQKNQFHRCFFDNPFWNSPYSSDSHFYSTLDKID